MYDEIELVNHMLTALGKSTTPTLETLHPAVIKARAVLMSYNKTFQGRGWWFNREFALKLLPDNNGRVRLPDETLTFTVTQCVTAPRNTAARFIQRGHFVYDTVEHTDVLNTAIWADITKLLAYSDLPASAGAFLKHWAAQEAYLADDGDIQVYARMQTTTLQMEVQLKQDQARSINLNALNTPFGQQLRSRGYGGRGQNPNYIGG